MWEKEDKTTDVDKDRRLFQILKSSIASCVIRICILCIIVLANNLEQRRRKLPLKNGLKISLSFASFKRVGIQKFSVRNLHRVCLFWKDGAALHNFRGIVFPIEKYSCERDKGGIKKKMEQKLESIGDREPTERYAFFYRSGEFYCYYYNDGACRNLRSFMTIFYYARWIMFTFYSADRIQTLLINPTYLLCIVSANRWHDDSVRNGTQCQILALMIPSMVSIINWTCLRICQRSPFRRMKNKQEDSRARKEF